MAEEMMPARPLYNPIEVDEKLLSLSGHAATGALADTFMSSYIAEPGTDEQKLNGSTAASIKEKTLLPASNDDDTHIFPAAKVTVNGSNGAEPNKSATQTEVPEFNPLTEKVDESISASNGIESNKPFDKAENANPSLETHVKGISSADANPRGNIAMNSIQNEKSPSTHNNKPLSTAQSGHYGPPPAMKPAAPLNIVIIGAGIGGLTAAASLRQAGHHVKLFEQSRFSNEIGAAIHVGPNASRLLEKLNYDPVKLRGVHCKGFSMFKSDASLTATFSNYNVLKASQTPWYLAHRVDLHNELRRLALDIDRPGKPAELFLESKVVQVDEEGLITLDNGITYQADLIVAADGIHSRIREAVFEPAKPRATGTAAYRFVVDSSAVFGNPDCLPINPEDGRCLVIVGGSKRVVVYPCRDNTLLNFVCMHESGPVGETAEGWNSTATADDVVETFKDFSPSIVNMLKKAENVKCWQLLERDIIPSWIKGRVCLIGDAAHPMLPHQGQGGGQAMEDGAALGPLFTLGTKRENVAEVLELYQQARHYRGSKIQWLSATQFAGGKNSINPMVTQKFIFEHDVTEYARHLRSSKLII